MRRRSLKRILNAYYSRLSHQYQNCLRSQVKYLKCMDFFGHIVKVLKYGKIIKIYKS